MESRMKSVWMQLSMTLMATTIMVLTGLNGGWSSAALVKLHSGDSVFNVTSSEGAWIASLYNLGMVPGCLYTRFAVDMLGRRPTILSSVIPYIIGWIIIALSREAWHVYIARFIAGIGFGIASSVSAIYVGEISEKRIRGALSSLTKFMLNFGALLSYIIGPPLSYEAVAYLSLAITSVYLVLAFFFVVETPYYYMKTGNKENAKKVLMKLRGASDAKAVDEEFDAMKKFVNDRADSNFKSIQFFTNPLYRKAMLLVVGIKTCQQLTGYQAIMYYLQTIFEKTSMNLKPSIATIIYGIMQVLAGIVAMFVVDKYGRKPTLYISLFGVFVSLTAVGVYFFIQDFMEAGPEVMSKMNCMPLIGIITFCVAFNVGIGPLVYVLEGELFTTDVKGAAVSYAISYGAIVTFASAKLYQVISDAIGVYVSFWFFAFVAVLGIVFVYFFLPETKGRTFSEIQLILEPKFSPQLAGV